MSFKTELIEDAIYIEKLYLEKWDRKYFWGHDIMQPNDNLDAIMYLIQKLLIKLM